MMLELQATPEEVMRAVEAFQQFGREHGLAEKVVFGLALALEECGANIVDHAYRRDSSKRFRVHIENTVDAITIELRDEAPAFDPTSERVTKSVADEATQTPGGRGLPLVRHYTDEISYRREAGENVLRLTKKLSPKAT